MKEYKVSWTRYPTAFNDTRVLFIEAESPEAAREIAKDHVERHCGVPREDFMIGRSPSQRYRDPMHGIEEVKPVPEGRVL